jgi:hypothetical protein
MQEDMLKQLLENTFAKLACPLHGNGIYAELQNAIIAAYNLGKKRDNQDENSLSLAAGS